MTNNREYTNEEISIALKKIRNRLNKGIVTIDDYRILKYFLLPYVSKIISREPEYISIDKESLNTDIEDTYEEYVDPYKLDSEIKLLIQSIYHAGLLNKFSFRNSEYIVNNSPLLPLMLADGDDSMIKAKPNFEYLTLCMMHREKTPSLKISDLKNIYYCFGCGAGGSVMAFFNSRKDMNTKKTLELLSQIYLYNVPNMKEIDSSIIKHYQDYIISDRYKEIVEMGYEKNKGLALNDEIYKKRCDTIERIRNHEYDSNFVYDVPQKSIRIRPGRFN